MAQGFLDYSLMQPGQQRAPAGVQAPQGFDINPMQQAPMAVGAPDLSGVPLPAKPDASISPELMKQVLANQGYEGQQAGIARQRKLADMLRADAKSQLQGVQAGKIYRAPGAANLLASLFASYQGGATDRAAAEAQTALDKQMSEQGEAFWKRLTRGTKPEEAKPE